jgi:hypothetical protein
MMVTSMETLITGRRASAVTILLVAAAACVFTGITLENTASGTWVSPCEVAYALDPSEIIHVGDTLYLSSERIYVSSERSPAIYLLKSSDGCNWSNVGLTMFGDGESVWRHSPCLFTTPDGNLGMVWIETPSKVEKESMSTIFLSRFDGSTWSEPKILCQREEIYILDDVMVLENGALLLLWNERLVQQVKDGDRTFQYSGCDVVYRAYISSDELLIERVIEPEDPWSCKTDGYSFVDDGQHIWCVFLYGMDRTTATIYRSGSVDGKQWSPPEPVQISEVNSRRVFITPQGEIGFLDYEVGKRDLFLLTSPDWKNWSREKLLRAENSIRGAMITEGPDTMWGFIFTEGTEDELFFIHTSKEPTGEFENRMRIVTILNILSLSCIVLLLVFVLSWIWKYKNKVQY